MSQAEMNLIKPESDMLVFEKLETQIIVEKALLTVRTTTYANYLEPICLDGKYILKSQFVDYILESVVRISKRRDISLKVLIDSDPRIIERENQIVQAVKTMADKAIRSEQSFQKACIRKILYALVFGLSFMYLLFKSEGILTIGIENSILIEGIKVGGWMYMWQAFQTLGFDYLENRRKIKKIRKLKNIVVEFKYSHLCK